MSKQNGAKPMPDMEKHQKSTKVLNLTVLQRIDPFVEEILITASHVAFYEFNADLNQWSRKDVEGSLFVVKRSAQPRFQFIVMNRRTTDNLVEDLLGDFEYDVQVPYLLYRNATQEVIGIWFYNEHDCKAVANLFSRVLSAYSKVSPKPKMMLKKSDFEEMEAAPTLAAMEGPIEPAPTVPHVPDDSFMNFFSAAINVGIASNGAISGPPLQSSATIPISSYTPNVGPSPIPTQQSVPSLPTPSTPLMPLLDTTESSINSNHSTNLVKPSFFAPTPTLMMPLISSSAPTAPFHPPVTMQRPYGTPLLQPFPPPTPPSYLAPTPNYDPVITRDKLQNALVRLVQNDHFIDMVYREMLNSHHS